MKPPRSGPRRNHRHRLLTAPYVRLARGIVPPVQQLRAPSACAHNFRLYPTRAVRGLPRTGAALRDFAAPVPLAEFRVRRPVPDSGQRLTIQIPQRLPVQNLAWNYFAIRKDMRRFPRILFTRENGRAGRKGSGAGRGHLSQWHRRGNLRVRLCCRAPGAGNWS